MNSVPPLRLLETTEEQPPALHLRAMDNLRYIRETMERAGSFTAVSGAAMCAIGAMALLTAVLAPGGPASPEWLRGWMLALVLSVIASGWGTVRKAREAGLPLVTGPVRKFLLAFSPPMAVGAVLTAVLIGSGDHHLLPGIWLLLYGTAVVCAGTYSVRIIPAMGAAFMLLGTGALVTGPAWADVLMAAGFGGLHLLFGVLIVRGHGG